MKTLALEFGTNMYGKLKPEIKEKLQAVIDNPCQETWENAYNIILRFKPMTTLWQAVLEIDRDMPIGRYCSAKWDYIPSSKTIVKAINKAILGQKKQELN